MCMWHSCSWRAVGLQQTQKVWADLKAARFISEGGGASDGFFLKGGWGFTTDEKRFKAMSSSQVLGAKFASKFPSGSCSHRNSSETNPQDERSDSDPDFSSSRVQSHQRRSSKRPHVLQHSEQSRHSAPTVGAPCLETEGFGFQHRWGSRCGVGTVYRGTNWWRRGRRGWGVRRALPVLQFSRHSLRDPTAQQPHQEEDAHAQRDHEQDVVLGGWCHHLDSQVREALGRRHLQAERGDKYPLEFKKHRFIKQN